MDSTENSNWGNSIVWSHSIVDISSDDESNHRSILQGSKPFSSLRELDDDSSVEQDHDSFGMHRIMRWEHTFQSLSPERLSRSNNLGQNPVRRRAHTMDGSTLRSSRDIRYATQSNNRNILSENSDSLESLNTCSHPERRRNSTLASRGFLFLCLIAVYTIFLLPYPTMPIDVQRMIELQEAKGSLLSESLDSQDEILGSYLGAKYTGQGKNNTSETTILSPVNIQSVNRTRGILSFARRRTKLKHFRKQEVVDFLQQTAIQQQQYQLKPWHINLGILLSVALWALADCLSRKQKSTPKNVLPTIAAEC